MEDNVASQSQQAHQLDSTVADQLKKYFFEPGNFAKHLTDMGFDIGKLRQTTPEKINQAEQILITLDTKIPELEKKDNVASEIESHNEITALGTQFYELIPHLPTVHQMPLDKLENVNTKYALVKNLRYILDAFETLNTTKPSQNFLESLYSNLKYTINPLAKDDKLYDIIKQYGETNSVSEKSTIYLEVNSIFNCALKTSKNNENTLSTNKMLAWYGDRLACYSGIISKGFQYKDTMLDGGEPAYCFADSIVKAMSSCYLDRYNREAFLLLCEVALGDNLEVDSMEDIKQLDKKYDSVKLRGKMVPVVESKQTVEGDVNIPLGKVESVNEGAKSLYNNYMVFNADQIKLRYIVKFDIKYH